MAYRKEVYELAREELHQRRLAAEARQENRHEMLVQKIPQLEKIEKAMAECGLEVAQAILHGGDVRSAIDAIAKNNLAYQQQRRQLLRCAGYPEDYLELQFHCPLCKDEGFVNGRICQCHQRLLKEIACRQLSEISPLKFSSFESFDLAYYPSAPDVDTGISPRQRMTEIYQYCLDYAANFSELSSPSLFLYGATGLGKTHLSLAIAGKVTENGYGVVYGSAQNLLNTLQNEYFGRSSEPRGTTEQLLQSCDLLILDDLGAEFSSSFTVSAVYNIVNSRLLTAKPVIISTNLSLRELEEKYSQRVTSRIMGNYVSLRFFGRDIRQIKRSMGKQTEEG